MKYTLLQCVLLSLAWSAGAAALEKRTKRYAGFNLAGIGGTTGCVTTGGKLYINGLYERELNAAEVNELNAYHEEHDKYKQELRAWLNETRGGLNLVHSQGKKGKQLTLAIEENLPKPPKKPSFCQLGNITQYYFDGCMVQNNKVYVGSTFARDLNEKEINELQNFDRKMTEYQASALRQRTKNLFGGKTNIWDLLYMGSKQATSTPATGDGTATTEESVLEVPVAPSFCTAIY